MPETPLDRVLAIGTLVAAAALVVMVATNWESLSGSAVPVTGAAVTVQQASVEVAAPRRRPVPPPVETDHRRTTPERVQAAKPASSALVISATRGPSWLEVRAANSTGAQLYYGTLDRGARTEFDRLPVWVRLGAAESVDITLAGSPIESLPVGDNGVVQFVASGKDVITAPDG